MPLDYSDPLVLKFLTENFNKENEKRVGWFIKNKEKIIETATFREGVDDYNVEDIYRTSFELYLPAFSRQHAENFVNHRRKALRDDPIVGKSATIKNLTRPIPEQMIFDLQSEAIMKPIEPDIVKILYEGIPYGGRQKYLKARRHKLPEEKYYLGQTSNQEIGWQLKEGNRMNKPLKHGRLCTLTRELNTRTGPQPDPHYYQRPLQDPYAKFVNL